MKILIADTFTDSLARLTGDEQRATKVTAFELQLNPANPGFNYHKLDKAKDKRFWSIRVNADIRLIVHRSDGAMLLCYVSHHDAAYRWAERRKLETHPRTGAAQFVEVRETVREVLVPGYVQALPAVPPPSDAVPDLIRSDILSHVSSEVLLSYGVPEDWVSVIQMCDTDDAVMLACVKLPSEAAEAVIDLWIGRTPRAVPEQLVGTDPFSHPDAQRRFRVMGNREELERALNAPWDRWSVFLHPEQQSLVERDYIGPARGAGSAGTGKTIVALHRAVHVARQSDGARVLLTTFSDTLANVLAGKLKCLVGTEPRIAERIEVSALDSLAKRLYRAQGGKLHLATSQDLGEMFSGAADASPGHAFTTSFLLAEWEQVVDAWQLQTWDDYRNVARLGRKTRVPESQRKVLWSIFEGVRNGLAERSWITMSGIYGSLAADMAKGANSPFTHAVVDEAQDLSVAQLRFLAALVSGRPDGLFFAGDLGQRIFQQPFSWRSLGVDIRGRSRSLRINYRTSHQIRIQADQLLGKSVSDIDGDISDRSDTVSVFNGVPPTLKTFASKELEIDAVKAWVLARIAEGVLPHEIAVVVRSNAELPRATAAVQAAGLIPRILDERVQTSSGNVSVVTMHIAKGLEFRCVAVMACDDEIIPLQQRVEEVGDAADLEEIYNTERHLLYVACTRARDQLLVTSVDPASEFLEDLRNR